MYLVVQSKPDGWTFISWNEITEGTYIVPLTRYNDAYDNYLASIITNGQYINPLISPFIIMLDSIIFIFRKVYIFTSSKAFVVTSCMLSFAESSISS